MRGNPASNDEMTDPGRSKGLQLIRGVIFDAHFRERGRHDQQAELVDRHPQMLGIGVDSKTDLRIRGREATVPGASVVDGLDRRNGRMPRPKGTAVNAGGMFDLGEGPPLPK